MKVLIVDDERSIRNTLKDILEFEGHNVDLAQDGKEGLDKALQGNYDVVFCDIKMPGMDGVEVLEKLVENGDKEESELHVVLMAELVVNRFRTEYSVFVRQIYIPFACANEVRHERTAG